MFVCGARSRTGIKESDTGLSAPSLWDLVADQQMLQQEQPLQVARNTKIINADSDEPQYVINIKQIAKYVVKLGEKVSPTDIEEGMRVGVDRVKYQIQVRFCFFSGFHTISLSL
jgi:26S proteasome regulatory subunit T1